MEALTWCYGIKPHEEVIVFQGNDVLGSSERLAEDDGLCGGIIGIAFEKRDE